jgi:hypothetical protein
MMFSRSLSASAAVPALALVLGCAAGAPAKPQKVETAPVDTTPTALEVNKTWFLAGERMEFQMSLHGIVGGTARMAVGDPGVIEDKNVIIVRSQVESAGAVALIKTIRDDVTSWIDIDSGLPIYLKADVKFGDREALIETRFAGGQPGPFTIDLTRPGTRTRKYKQQMPAHRAAFDGHSIIGALRGWDAKPGEHAFFYVLSGRRLWHNTVRMSGREKIRTALGKTSAIRLDGVAKRLSPSLRDDPRQKEPRRYTVWISDDAERRPLLVVGKTEYGDVKVELTSYTRPEDWVASE